MTNDNNKLIAYVLLVVLLNGFFSINIIEKNKRFYNSQLNNQMAVTKTTNKKGILLLSFIMILFPFLITNK